MIMWHGDPDKNKLVRQPGHRGARVGDHNGMVIQTRTSWLDSRATEELG